MPIHIPFIQTSLWTKEGRILDLHVFMATAYDYWRHRGKWAAIQEKLIDFLNSFFVFAAVYVLLFAVNWDLLMSCDTEACIAARPEGQRSVLLPFGFFWSSSRSAAAQTSSPNHNNSFQFSLFYSILGMTILVGCLAQTLFELTRLAERYLLQTEMQEIAKGFVRGGDEGVPSFLSSSSSSAAAASFFPSSSSSADTNASPLQVIDHWFSKLRFSRAIAVSLYNAAVDSRQRQMERIRRRVVGIQGQGQQREGEATAATAAQPPPPPRQMLPSELHLDPSRIAGGRRRSATQKGEKNREKDKTRDPSKAKKTRKSNSKRYTSLDSTAIPQQQSRAREEERDFETQQQQEQPNRQRRHHRGREGGRGVVRENVAGDRTDATVVASEYLFASLVGCGGDSAASATKNFVASRPFLGGRASQNCFIKSAVNDSLRRFEKEEEKEEAGTQFQANNPTSSRLSQHHRVFHSALTSLNASNITVDGNGRVGGGGGGVDSTRARRAKSSAALRPNPLFTFSTPYGNAILGDDSDAEAREFRREVCERRQPYEEIHSPTTINSSSLSRIKTSRVGGRSSQKGPHRHAYANNEDDLEEGDAFEMREEEEHPTSFFGASAATGGASSGRGERRRGDWRRAQSRGSQHGSYAINMNQTMDGRGDHIHNSQQQDDDEDHIGPSSDDSDDDDGSDGSLLSEEEDPFILLDREEVRSPRDVSSPPSHTFFRDENDNDDGQGHQGRTRRRSSSSQNAAGKTLHLLFSLLQSTVESNPLIPHINDIRWDTFLSRLCEAVQNDATALRGQGLGGEEGVGGVGGGGVHSPSLPLSSSAFDDSVHTNTNNNNAFFDELRAIQILMCRDNYLIALHQPRVRGGETSFHSLHGTDNDRRQPFSSTSSSLSRFVDEQDVDDDNDEGGIFRPSAAMFYQEGDARNGEREDSGEEEEKGPTHGGGATALANVRSSSSSPPPTPVIIIDPPIIRRGAFRFLDENIQRYLIGSLFDEFNSATAMPFDRQHLRMKETLLLFCVFTTVTYPFIVAVFSTRLIVKNIVELRSRASELIVGRDWSSVAKWSFRLFNEVPHLSEKRLRNGASIARAMIDAATPPIPLLRAAQRLASAVIFLIVVISFFNAAMLTVGVAFDRTLLWWLSSAIVLHSVASDGGGGGGGKDREYTHLDDLKRLFDQLYFISPTWLSSPSVFVSDICDVFFPSRLFSIAGSFGKILALPITLYYLRLVADGDGSEVSLLIRFIRDNSEAVEGVGSCLKAAAFTERWGEATVAHCSGWERAFREIQRQEERQEEEVPSASPAPIVAASAHQSASPPPPPSRILLLPPLVQTVSEYFKKILAPPMPSAAEARQHAVLVERERRRRDAVPVGVGMGGVSGDQNTNVNSRDGSQRQHFAPHVVVDMANALTSNANFFLSSNQEDQHHQYHYATRVTATPPMATRVPPPPSPPPPPPPTATVSQQPQQDSTTASTPPPPPTRQQTVPHIVPTVTITHEHTKNLTSFQSFVRNYDCWSDSIVGGGGGGGGGMGPIPPSTNPSIATAVGALLLL